MNGVHGKNQMICYDDSSSSFPLVIDLNNKGATRSPLYAHEMLYIELYSLVNLKNFTPSIDSECGLVLPLAFDQFVRSLED